METQQEIQQLVRLLQSYEETIEVLRQQHALLDATIDDHASAQQALEAMDDLDEGRTIIVPLGADQFLHASITEPDKVLSGVGADVVVEEPRERALERSRERVQELENGKEQVAERAEEIAEEAERLQDRIAELYRGVQGGGAGSGPGPAPSG